jgi:hypothetical protein
MDKEQINQNKVAEKHPMLFSNNVAVGTTLTEMVITFAVGGSPQTAVYLSLPVAKHLAKLVNDTITDYEKKMNLQITSVDELFQQQLKSENDRAIENK